LAIPKSVENIILKAIEKGQIDRYSSASQMLIDLENVKRNPVAHVNSINSVADTSIKHIPITTTGKIIKENKFSKKQPSTKKNKNSKIALSVNSQTININDVLANIKKADPSLAKDIRTMIEKKTYGNLNEDNVNLIINNISIYIDNSIYVGNNNKLEKSKFLNKLRGALNNGDNNW